MLWRWWTLWKLSRHCRHDNVRGIYGDEINHVGGWRNQCLDCWRYLDGPVQPRGWGVRRVEGSIT
jgi:hypothetical protein